MLGKIDHVSNTAHVVIGVAKEELQRVLEEIALDCGDVRGLNSGRRAGYTGDERAAAARRSLGR